MHHGHLDGKMINIYTFADKRPDFIELQSKTMKKFIKDEFNLKVFDNSSTPHLSAEIHRACEKNEIEVLQTEKNHRTPNHACWVPINYCLRNHLKDNDDVTVIIDSDIFMINDFSFFDYIKDYDIAGVYQQRKNLEIEYIWNALVVINNKQVFKKNLSIDFEPIQPNITDVGGKTSSLTKDPNVKIKWTNHTADISCAESSKIFSEFDYHQSFGFQILEKSFLHYYRGSNWDGQAQVYHAKKTECLQKVLDASPFTIDDSFAQNFIGERMHSHKHWNGCCNLIVPKQFSKLDK